MKSFTSTYLVVVKILLSLNSHDDFYVVLLQTTGTVLQVARVVWFDEYELLGCIII